MQIRCKFDGCKVINRIQSGSFQLRCCGAWLQKNLGKAWEISMREKMTSSPANLSWQPKQWKGLLIRSCFNLFTAIATLDSWLLTLIAQRAVLVSLDCIFSVRPPPFPVFLKLSFQESTDNIYCTLLHFFDKTTPYWYTLISVEYTLLSLSPMNLTS